MKKEKITNWVEWTCPTCGANMSDPSTIKETVCTNNHTTYLGKVHETNHGFYRRAFKSAGERRREQHQEKLHHETATLVMSGAFRKNNPVRVVRE